MKQSYWSILNGSIVAVVPKKRGYGFLRQPIGHHNNALSLWIDDNTSLKGNRFSTVTGLDGYLHFNAHVSTYDTDAIKTGVLDPLGKYLNCKFDYMDIDAFLTLVIS